jgi:hypothetical protein
MNSFSKEIPEFTQTTPPEFPPEFPINPPENPPVPTVSAPMIYVESRERVEYLVKTFDPSKAEKLEAELNNLGYEGWWLTQIIQQGKQNLFVFCRRKIS